MDITTFMRAKEINDKLEHARKILNELNIHENLIIGYEHKGNNCSHGFTASIMNLNDDIVLLDKIRKHYEQMIDMLEKEFASIEPTKDDKTIEFVISNLFTGTVSAEVMVEEMVNLSKKMLGRTSI